jgi:hypothetical protein
MRPKEKNTERFFSPGFLLYITRRRMEIERKEKKSPRVRKNGNTFQRLLLRLFILF